MTPEQRSNAARQAACARWAEKRKIRDLREGTVLNDMNENDWLCTLVFCYDDDKEEVAAEAETIGYLEGFAMLTETRLLALRGGHNPEDGVLLLFSFDTPAHKAEFRRLVDSNEFTAREQDFWTVPDAAEIARAQPLAAVLPPEVAEHAKLVALTVIGCAKPGGEA